MRVENNQMEITDIKYYICIDRIENNDMAGRIYHCFRKEQLCFDSLLELVFQLENEMNGMGYPQETTANRYFQGKGSKLQKIIQKEWQNAMKESEIRAHKGGKATFVIEVTHRENATWQGNVCWVEGNQKLNFRSALELIRLMDSINSIMANKM